MGRRIALVVSAASGAELTGGRRDAMRVYSVLTDEDLGCCDPASPTPVVECSTRAQFEAVWHELIANWEPADQLIFYFSGHGAMKNSKYALAFGAPPQQHYLPFDHIAADLQAHGVRRAVLILDACHSGAALQAGAKELPPEMPCIEQPLPEGVVVLASCRESELSFEFEDGAGSVFTHLFTRAIRSGLGGISTADDLIGPEDVMSYINASLGESAYKNYPQRPTYKVSQADRGVWIARNKTPRHAPAPLAPAVPRSAAHSLDELRLLYDRTEKSRHPCSGSTLDCLDWELVSEYASAARTPLAAQERRDSAAGRLGLYSLLSEKTLHNAAVLCFAHAPHALLQQGRAIFIRGDRARRQVHRVDVLGPLSRQAQQLTELVMNDVFRRLGWRPADGAATMLGETVREAVSNAIAHRDYSSNELVRVAMKDDAIEITNPGAFPNGATFDSLLSSGSYSAPNDAAIAWYLTTLLAYEGVGRGFSVYRAFREGWGDQAIECESNPALRTLKLLIRIPRDIARTSGSLPAPPQLPPPREMRSLTMHGIGAALPRVQAEHPSPPRVETERTGSEELVGGRYRLGPEIGSGASGSVYLAEDTKLSREVAVKILSKRFTTAEVRERFMREARLAARIGHPGIVTVYDVGDEPDRLFIVMELISGFGVNTLIERSGQVRTSCGDEFFLMAAWLVHDIADTLAAAHESLVIHRDIKPSNLLVDEAGRPHILDFGISVAATAADSSKSRLTQTGVIVGTPYYMSPEQALGRAIDARADLYSLGTVMYELLCQRLPFEGETFINVLAHILRGEVVPPTQVNAAIPDELERICLKALQREPGDRFANAQSMAADLRAYLPTNPAYNTFGQDRARLWTFIASALEPSRLESERRA